MGDRPQKPRRGFAKWWNRYVGSVAFVLLLVVTVIGFRDLEKTASDAEGAATRSVEAVAHARAAAKQAAQVAARVRREQAVRVDQTCVLFERTYREDRQAYKRNRRSLRITTRFLAGVPPAEQGTQLNVAIRASLGRQKRELEQELLSLKAKRPPRYCLKSGVGLQPREAKPNPRGTSQAPRSPDPMRSLACVLTPGTEGQDALLCRFT